MTVGDAVRRSGKDGFSISYCTIIPHGASEERSDAVHMLVEGIKVRLETGRSKLVDAMGAHLVALLMPYQDGAASSSAIELLLRAAESDKEALDMLLAGMENNFRSGRASCVLTQERGGDEEVQRALDFVLNGFLSHWREAEYNSDKEHELLALAKFAWSLFETGNMTRAAAQLSVSMLASELPTLQLGDSLRSRCKPKVIQVVFDRQDPQQVGEQQGVLSKGKKEEEAAMSAKIFCRILLHSSLPLQELYDCEQQRELEELKTVRAVFIYMAACRPDGWLLPAAPGRPSKANMHNFSTWLPAVYKVVARDDELVKGDYKSSRAFDVLRNFKEDVDNMLKSVRLKGIDLLQALLSWIPQDDLNDEDAEAVLPTFVNFLLAVYQLDERYISVDAINTFRRFFAVHGERGKFALVRVLFGEEMLSEREPTAVLNLRGEAIYMLKKEIQWALEHGEKEDVAVRELLDFVCTLLDQSLKGSRNDISEIPLVNGPSEEIMASLNMLFYLLGLGQPSSSIISQR
ncbi:hypothetical protein GUITHDRAFT_109994 [Guillardia theta CCMP2712]|uniref:Uncharacterized protein n=1 Tax=Guillardia theta (strain CCMP2712) TaxID=905079 RepID=L1J793_GUITC|nr:hypothetical protein GUITHDRAFT_109994 [Guillardia theta CCMP2712]EKX44207.1 hypothetical protein GUITHDRAFT_109994 [Guillardia theta CCMP2712]|eukprot:XP_005831187.1 hypothetical protein GUITHDRAFT_109994 [Guillardia theta CCMP2712]